MRKLALKAKFTSPKMEYVPSPQIALAQSYVCRARRIAAVPLNAGEELGRLRWIWTVRC